MATLDALQDLRLGFRMHAAKGHNRSAAAVEAVDGSLQCYAVRTF